MVAGGLQQAALDSDYNRVQAPQPDIRANCKAMIGFVQALTVFMAGCVASMQRVLDMHRLLKQHRRQIHSQAPTMQWLSDDVSMDHTLLY